MKEGMRNRGRPDWQAFNDWYEVFYEPHEWPDDALLVLSWCREDRSAPSSAHLPLSDREAIWEELVRRGSDRKVWTGVAPRSPQALRELITAKQQKRRAAGEPFRSKRHLLEWTRGGKQECYAIPGVWLDLDIAGGEHKKKDLPPAADVERLLEEFPLGRPTVLVHTGGGYHAWYGFAELLENAAEEEDVLGRVKAWLEGQKLSTGYDYDTGVFTRERVLRPGGSLIGKGGNLNTISTVELNPALRYTVCDFDRFPPPPDSEPMASTVVPNQAAGARVRTARQPLAGGVARPGDRLAAELPVSRLLSEVFRCRRRGERWVFPRADGTYSATDTHLITSMGIRYKDGRADVEDGIERVGVFGERAAAALGLECQATPATSFTVLTNAFCAGDWSLAARVARAFDGEPDALVALLQTRPGVGDLAVLVTERQAKEHRRQAGPKATHDHDGAQLTPVVGSLLRAMGSGRRTTHGVAPGSVLAQLPATAGAAKKQPPRRRSA